MKTSVCSFLKISTLFAIALLSITACKKKNDPQPSTGGTTISGYYFEGSLGDAKVSYKQGVNNFYTATQSSSRGYYNNNIIKEYNYYYSEGAIWTKIINGNSTGENGLAILYNKFIPNVDSSKFPTQKDLESIYPVGKSTVFLSFNSSQNDGWEIEVLDTDGNVWRTNYKNANQSASFVKIDSRTNHVLNATQNMFTIKGSLSCTVYNNAGESKIFSGSFNQVFSFYSSNKQSK